MDSLQNVDMSNEYEFYEYIHERGNEFWKSKTDIIDVSNNKLSIKEFEENIYAIWETMNIHKFKYNRNHPEYDGGDEFRIMDNMEYSYDYNNMEWVHNNIKTVLEEVIKGHEKSIININDEYLILDEY